MTISTEIKEIFRLVFSSKSGIPKELRVILVTNTEMLYLNNGNFSMSSRVFGHSSLREDRGEILSMFAEMESIIIELIRLHIVGWVHNDKSKLCLKLIESVGMNRMLRELRNAKIIDDALYKNLDSLFIVRNQLAHRFYQGEIEYRSKPLFSSRTHANFTAFLQQSQTTWNQLIKCYEIEQSQIDFKELKDSMKRRIKFKP